MNPALVSLHRPSTWSVPPNRGLHSLLLSPISVILRLGLSLVDFFLCVLFRVFTKWPLFRCQSTLLEKRKKNPSAVDN